MKTKITKIHLIYILAVCLTLVTTIFGLLYNNNGQSYEYINQYGDLIKIYGKGLYSNDSYFKAPIFKGTDLTVLIIVIPLFIFALILNIKNKSPII